MKEQFYLFKLFILRIVMIVAMAAILIMRPQKLQYKWLCHYLLGTGRPLKVPQWALETGQTAIQEALELGPVYTWKLGKKWASNIPRNKYCVYSSTLYDGSGFEGRPILFYLLGGFSFKASNPRRGEHGDSVYVSGTDIYDWHPATEGEYHCSSCGVPTKILALLKFLFPEHELFFPYGGGWPLGNSGISNQLWEEFERVGAKPFQSWFEGWVSLGPNGKADPDCTYRRPRSAASAEKRAKQSKAERR